MSSFEDINKRIQADIEANKVMEPVASKGVPSLNPDGTPVMVPVGVKGRIVSKPGTESVTLDASVFQMMTCISNTPGREKTRYCIVEKEKHAKYGNNFVTAGGWLTHVITREVYTLMIGVLNNAGSQIIQLTSDVERAEEKADLYKLTVDALRKNGIID